MNVTKSTFHLALTLASAIVVAGLPNVGLAGETLIPSGATSFDQFEDRTFQEAMPGVEVTSVVGDFSKGAHGTLVRLAEGTALPLHYYTDALGGIVISGKIAHPIPGNTASQGPLEAGDSFSFEKEEPHETINLGDGPAVFFIYQKTAWEFRLN